MGVSSTITIGSSGGIDFVPVYMRLTSFQDWIDSHVEEAAPTPGTPEPPRRPTGGEWTIDTIAGRGVGDNGPAVQAMLARPFAVTLDAAGNLYVADTGTHRVRRVDARGIITTIARNGAVGFSGDGGPAVRAQLDRPFGLAVDAAGNLYIADYGNNRIRRVDARGIITTVAGTGEGFGFGGDGGPATQAQLVQPEGVAVDAAGNLYIADTIKETLINHRFQTETDRGRVVEQKNR